MWFAFVLFQSCSKSLAKISSHISVQRATHLLLIIQCVPLSTVKKSSSRFLILDHESHCQHLDLRPWSSDCLSVVLPACAYLCTCPQIANYSKYNHEFFFRNKVRVFPPGSLCIYGYISRPSDVTHFCLHFSYPSSWLFFPHLVIILWPRIVEKNAGLRLHLCRYVLYMHSLVWWVLYCICTKLRIYTNLFHAAFFFSLLPQS